MFDREKAMWDLRNQLATSDALSGDDLLELEGHLLDELDALALRGLSEEEAFLIAARRLGEPSAIAREYAKGHPIRTWRAPLFWSSAGAVLVLAGMALINSAMILTFSLGSRFNMNFALMNVLVWAEAFAAPAAFLAIAALYVRARPASVPPARIWVPIVVAAALVIVGEPWVNPLLLAQTHIAKHVWVTLNTTCRFSAGASLVLYASVAAWIMVRLRAPATQAVVE